MNTLRQLTFFILIFGFVPGCATLGLEKPQTFNQRVAYAYANITGARAATLDALGKGAITADDAENVQALANRARAGVDAARAAHALGNATDATDRLRLAEGILTEITAYLARRGIK